MHFQEMKEQLSGTDYESMAIMFLSMNFGFVFLNASFGKKLTVLEEEDYIRSFVQLFLNGIRKPEGGDRI